MRAAFALVEERFEYDECNAAAPFVSAGNAVFEIEYGDSGAARAICPRANALDLDALVKHSSLDAFRIACR